MISAIAREEAKRYNREYDVFEAYSCDTGDSKFYDHYGVAYRYSIERAKRGEVITIFGHRYDESLQDWVPEELISF